MLTGSKKETITMSETLTATQSETRGDLANWLRQRARDLAPFLTLMVLLIFFSVTTDSFLRLVNLRNILAQVSTLAVVSTGITFVLLCGEIDLSIAAVATMTGVVAAALIIGEPLGLRVVLAMVLTLSGVTLALQRG